MIQGQDMNRKVLLTSIISIMFGITVAYGDSTITSKGYVDTQIDTTQVKIPATGTGNGGIGDTVMTYTNTPGRIGERGIYTGESSYNASSDADKLITASALKGAFDSIPTTDTTTLVCANPGTCDLWTIVDQTAMGPAGINLMSLIGNVVATGQGYISNDGEDSYNASIYGLSQNGTFAVNYGDGKIVRGKSRCSTQGVTKAWHMNNNTFESDHFTSTLSDSVGENCWCQLDGYTTTGGSMQSLSGSWVFEENTGDVDDCALICADNCAGSLFYNTPGGLAFRAAFFNGTP